MNQITYTKTANGYVSNMGHTIHKSKCNNTTAWFVTLNKLPYTHKATLAEAKKFIQIMEGK